MPKKYHNIKALEQNRKILRGNLTTAEAVLWSALQGSQLDGRKFRRQHSIGRYILDFYCPFERLAIELDGQGHFTLAGSENDYERDKHLEDLKIKTLRFENKFVMQQLENVLEEIRINFNSSHQAEGL